MKKLLLPIFFILGMIFISTIVSAKMTIIQDEGYRFRYKTEVPLQKGWNLIAGFEENSITSDSEVSKDDLKVVYIFNPFSTDNPSLKKYISVIPRSQEYDNLVFNTPTNEGFPTMQDTLMSQSAWVYSNKVGIIRFEYPVLKLKSLQLNRGWNFITLTPEMVEKNILDIRGNCNIEKAYGFEADRKEWVDILDRELPSYEASGVGFILKVTSPCQLLTSKSLNDNEIPPLPGEDNIINPSITVKGSGDQCIDEVDDFYKKDSVTIIKKDGKVYTKTDTCLEDGRVQEQICLNSEDYPGSKNFGAKYLQCPDGCEDGACICKDGNCTEGKEDYIIKKNYGSLNYNNVGGSSSLPSIFPLTNMIGGASVRYGNLVIALVVKYNSNAKSIFEGILNNPSIKSDYTQQNTPSGVIYLSKNDNTSGAFIWYSDDTVVMIAAAANSNALGSIDSILRDYITKYPISSN